MGVFSPQYAQEQLLPLPPQNYLEGLGQYVARKEKNK